MNSFQTLPIDSIPCFCPTWEEIKGKAHNYKTARLRSTGEYVQLCGTTRFIGGLELGEPCFLIRVAGFAGREYALTEQLCDFCL